MGLLDSVKNVAAKALPIAGAVVGGIYGGPVGATAGSAVGGAVGGALSGDKASQKQVANTQTTSQAQALPQTIAGNQNNGQLDITQLLALLMNGASSNGGTNVVA